MNAEELVVALKAEGATETQGEIEGVEESLSEAGDSMEDTSSRMGSIRKSWQGAMAALMGTLAVAVGGLLTQVPVIGEAMSGVMSVVQGLAFQLDQKLRPAIQPVTNGLYSLGAAIAEGDWGAVKDILSNAASTITSVNWSKRFQDIVRGYTDLLTGISQRLQGVDFKKQINNMIDGISNALNAINWGNRLREIISAIIGFFASVDWLGISADVTKALANGLGTAISDTNWGRIMNDIWTAISDFVKETNWSKLADDIIDGVAGALGSATDYVVGGIEDVFLGEDGLISDATQWGKDLIQNFADGIKQAADNALEGAVDHAKGKLDGISFDIPENDRMAMNWGQDFSGYFAQGMREGANQIPSATEVIETGGGGSDFRASRNETTKVFMDGRRVDEQTGRYGKGKTIRRGL